MDNEYKSPEEPQEDNYVIEDEEPVSDSEDGLYPEDSDGTEFDELPTDDDEESEEKRKRIGISTIKLLAEVMTNPIEGWKKVRRSGLSPEEVAAGCFYPLIAIASAACFMTCVYEANVTFSDCLIEALEVFVAFFFSNFLLIITGNMVMPKGCKERMDSDFGKCFIMYNLATLALFFILYTLLPMIGPVLLFLPLWTLYIAIRGMRFFNIPAEKSNMTKTLVCVLLIAVPLLCFTGLDILLEGIMI